MAARPARRAGLRSIRAGQGLGGGASARALAAVEDHDYYLNAGGDIALGVRPKAAASWRIGVENPFDRTQILAVRELRSGGIATSGTAARGAHIRDPRTGRPAGTFASVTVIGPSLLWADIYATAAFARGPGALRWLAKNAGEYEAITVERMTGRVAGMHLVSTSSPPGTAR
ncbi:FAD:protein FMN transferase [Fodinicola feengrottensis]|uniref:FAD:protein FMN transferase n=1 Tax=Fodinicola feengrottensis TaxID=435914 RepID=UPI0013D802F3|nr:FAD:protein FMN transferase [Fodinicola feengrottensis]